MVFLRNELIKKGVFQRLFLMQSIREYIRIITIDVCYMGEGDS